MKNNFIAYNQSIGIYVKDTTLNSIITGNVVSNNASSGISVDGGRLSLIKDNHIFNNQGTGLLCVDYQGDILNNLIYDNQNNGLYTSNTSSNIMGNNIHNNLLDGIYLSGGGASEIRSNKISSNGRMGLYLRSHTYPYIVNNLFTFNQNSGIFSDRCPHVIINNNTCYKTGTGIYIGGYSTDVDVTIRNNILWAAETGKYALQFGASNPDTMQYSSDYNNLVVESGAYTGYWNGRYDSLYNWQVGSGQDGGSLNYNPEFVSPETGDFHLQSPMGSYHTGYWNSDTNASICLNTGQFFLADSPLVSTINSESGFIELTDAGDFSSATDSVEIESDIIFYTGKDGNRLTGVTGIDQEHKAGEIAFQPIGSDYMLEPMPNGERANMGAYGNSGESSLSDKKTLPILTPRGGEKWSEDHNIE